MSTSESISTPRSTPKRALLLIVCLAQFMVILDVSIVNVALPSIHSGLGFSTTSANYWGGTKGYLTSAVTSSSIRLRVRVVKPVLGADLIDLTSLLSDRFLHRLFARASSLS